MSNKYYGNIKSQKHPLKFVLSKILIRSGLSRFFKIKRKYYRLRFYPTSESSRTLWIEPNYQIDTEDFVYDYLQNGDTFVDVGANIGIITLTAAVKVGSAGKVYSIEPHPTIFLNLNGNIELNNLNNIHTFSTALGNKKGEVNFTNNRSDSLNSVLENSGGITVPICKLDDLPINESSIELMKIDVEGYEKAVLEGARETIIRDRPSLLIEMEEAHTKQPIEEAIAAVEALDYRGLFLKHGVLLPIDAFDGNRHHRKAERREDYVFNFVFLPKETRDRD